MEEEKYTVSLYVAECSELRSEGKVYENIFSVSEALEARNSLPNNQHPSVGLRVHRKGEKAALDTVVDILIDNTIHLEVLEYVQGLMQNDNIMKYIAELIVVLPDANIQGIISEQLNDWIKKCAASHKNENNEYQKRLMDSLSKLTDEASDYAKSNKKSEQLYAAALVRYAATQKEAILLGQKHIDLNLLPKKADYVYLDKKIKKTESNIASKGGESYKKNSLLGKLYKYKEIVKSNSLQNEGMEQERKEDVYGNK